MLLPILALVAPQISELQAKLPVKGVSLLPDGPEAWKVRGKAEFYTSSRERNVIRVEVTRPGQNAYDVEIATVQSIRPVKKGDVILYSFRGRALTGDRESGRGAVTAFIQRGRPPWDGFDHHGMGFGKTWITQYRSAVADKDYPAGDLQLTLHVAGRAQVLEVADIVMLNLGPNVDRAKLPITQNDYDGRAADAPWRKRAETMIRRNRMVPLTVRVVDDRGRPVKNAAIRIQQQSHAYRFGSFTEYIPGETSPTADRYRAEFLKMFGHATVPIYWTDWGWESANARANYGRVMDWAERNKLPMKAHCLLWPSERYAPDALKGLKAMPDRLKETIFRAMDDRIAALRSRPFDNLDVLNEIKTETEFADAAGTGIYKLSFDKARAAWPKADLLYNDFGIFENGGDDTGAQTIWADRVRELQRLNAPLTMLGWQGHFGDSVTPPETVWRLLDRYTERFKLPFEITEFDVDTIDEKLQADYLRDLLTAWFAHPSTRGFTVWGFYEGTMWKPNAAFVRKDWSLKPNGKVWMDLVRKKWWTDASLAGGATGSARANVFKGRHRVIVRAQGATASAMVDASRPASVTVRLTRGRS